MLTKVFRLLSNVTRRQNKLALLVRADIKMSKGKTAAQCSHASILCYQRSQKVNASALESWCIWGQPKIVLKVDSLEEILQIRDEAHKANVVAEIVKDAGRTQLEPGTATVLGIGPDEGEKIDKLVRHLKLL
ncbi:peptidyl-tRNA hydrolase 2, mitochondrial [Episyrphus balteatus]|uniref:peptidyl-tRNA hydrolase 2, mitochondrial n=1 Tax=Episyrphus balteatus TaxID=286459 RepID=UPI002486628A|nr:peptidyl-tRNA hydrolase 2, mitochondrial [Episyrphus balteatus]